MSKTSRNITVDHNIFRWDYTEKYHTEDDSYVSGLFFSPQARKDIRIECFFNSHAHYYMGCYLNVGFIAIQNGQERTINFHKPGFISEFIRFVLVNKVDFKKQKIYRFDNGWCILEEMGFTIHKTPYVAFNKDN